MNIINDLFIKMIEYYSGDVKRIQHFMKVHSFAKLISEMEQLDKNIIELIEITALVHDIGIKSAEKKYNSNSGKYQEIEGPPIAEKMLSSMNLNKGIIERVTYLIGHHHTYTNIDGIDYQILIEADFLVNMYEDEMSREAILSAYNKIFKTASGKKLCNDLFLKIV